MNYETENEIQMMLARWFDFRKHVIVPNVAWGMFGDRECDLLIMRETGYLIEVEIKISVSDLKRDAEKTHRHYSPRIKELYFAMPEKMVASSYLIPEHAGIIIIRKSGWPEITRKATINTQARPLTDKEKFKLARLGAIRVWSLKESLQTCRKEVKA